jgi:hypothetical protein
VTLPMKEKEWQRLVVDLAALKGWFCYHTHDSRRSAPGFPDLVMVRPPRVVFAELKRGAKEKPTGDQERWLEALGACPGVETYLWRPDDWKGVEQVLKTEGEG